jgi:hypothetical protein
MRAMLILILILGVTFFTGTKFPFQSNRASNSTSQVTKPPIRQSVYKNSKRVGIDAEIAKLNKEVVQLKNKVDKLAQAFQLVQISQQPPVDDSADLITHQNIETEEYLTAEQEKTDQQQTELEQHFASEATDLAWVNRMEPEFQSSLNRLSDFGLKDTKMIYHECRATLCNAEFTHSKEGNPLLFSAALTMPEIERISVVSVLSDDGTPISKVYFFREGFVSNDVTD